ncbi:MAG: glycerophosphodiester phosphodiesterase, partial [Erythrobacter sp. RIFCSPHIGHO2_12_FULL_63_10]
WFAEDFTLAEIRTLRVKERIAAIRPANARFNDLYQVPTFDEIIDLLRAKEAETGRRIGLYPELKHPNFLLQEAGIDTVDLLVGALRRHGLDGADDLVIVQSFEIAPLQRLRRILDVKLAQLIARDGGPADEPGMRFAEMIAPSGLKAIARYADAIGVDIRLILNPDGSPTSLVADAKAAGLEVHAWTLRPENAFLPAALKSTGSDAAHGNAGQLLEMLRRAGVDGVFTDAPALAAKLRPAAP